MYIYIYICHSYIAILLQLPGTRQARSERLASGMPEESLSESVFPTSDCSSILHATTILEAQVKSIPSESTLTGVGPPKVPFQPN